MVSSETGTATVIGSSAGELTIEADLPHPAILLITDAYSSGWRVRPLETTAQKPYQVLPGDYTIRAVPLAAGHHHFQLEYLPQAYVRGKWLTLTSLLLFLPVVFYFLQKNRLSVTSETV